MVKKSLILNQGIFFQRLMACNSYIESLPNLNRDMNGKNYLKGDY